VRFAEDRIVSPAVAGESYFAIWRRARVHALAPVAVEPGAHGRGAEMLLFASRDALADRGSRTAVGVVGCRLSPTILSVTFRRYTDAAGVAKRKRIAPHTLRQVFELSF
jgi:hypothetical protein